jgi:antitoxin HigA-1
MGIARANLYRVFDGKAPVTAELALRFTRLTGGIPEFYLEMQNNFDLWRAESHLKDELAKIHPLR